MAIITLGTIVSDIRGSIGGVTFSRNAAGIIAKSKVVSKKNVTAKQALALQNNNAANVAWQSLTLSQKLNWSSYASAHTKTDRYGVLKTLTGYNWFTSIYNASIYTSGTWSVTPPAYGLPASIPGFTLNVNSADIIVNFLEPIDTDLLDVFIYTTAPINKAASLNRGLLRLTNKYDVDYESSFSIKEGWELAHGLQLSNFTPADNFYINAQIVGISKSSFITGTGVQGTSSFIGAGIGTSIIGSTFIVG